MMSGLMAVPPLLCFMRVCAVCSAGYKKQGDSCVPCEANTFKDMVGNNDTCTACADGKITNSTGKTASTDCTGELRAGLHAGYSMTAVHWANLPGGTRWQPGSGGTQGMCIPHATHATDARSLSHRHSKLESS